MYPIPKPSLAPGSSFVFEIPLVINKLAREIYFETNKATLTPASIRTLQDIVNLLKMFPFKQIQIEGHTDNTGTSDWNNRLSLQRAETVLAYLVEAGLDSNILTTKGCGASKPIAGNETAAGRAMNRRTVFVVYR